jgi:hypothetical protein
VPAEYTSEAGRAPALECTRCRALVLTVEAARTEEERDSVKTAIAVRAAICREAG